MKTIEVEKYREQILSEINDTSSDNAMDWIDTILRQFGEEVKDECMNVIDETITRGDTDAVKMIGVIRQNVVIK